MTHIVLEDYPEGLTCLTFVFAQTVNEVGKSIPDGIFIEHLLHYEKGTVPVWTAFIHTLESGAKIEALCSVFRYVVHDSNFHPGITVGHLRKMSYKELCQTGIVDQRAAFLVNAFSKD